MTPCYVALGDSMSIDRYPRLDLEGAGLGERLDDGDGTAPWATAGVGAASLFHRNHDELWPEFRGRDLAAMVPGVDKLDVCVDGATIGHTRDAQLPAVPAAVREAARIVTVTAGGNDLLGGLFDGTPGLARATARAVGAWRDLADRVLEAFPAALLVVTTVYDPTDGTGHLPGLADDMGELPLEHLAAYNDAVSATAAASDRVVVADVHARFLGHGLTAEPGARWFWDPSPIEPGARGASEIRRAWLEALPAGWPDA